MRTTALVLVTLALLSPGAHAGPFSRAKVAVAAPPTLRSVVTGEGNTMDADRARTIAAAFLRSSHKYGLPADLELTPGEIERVAPNEGRPITGAGGFSVVHETHHGAPMRYMTLVDGNGQAHDAGASPLVLREKVRSKMRFGSLLTGENLMQAGLTVGLGLMQVPNLFGGSGGASATALSGATLALLIGNTSKLFFDAGRAHRDGVVQSISQSVQFIKDRLDPKTRAAVYPTLAETYVFYKQKLAELSPGAVPITLADFSERVAAYGF